LQRKFNNDQLTLLKILEMKKYLMLGIAALSIFAGFTSCSSEDDIPVYTQDQIQRAKYETNFVQKYGNIGAGQNWGFSTTVTRGFMPTRSHWKNKNQYKDVMYVPDSVSNHERDVVTEWFTKTKSPASVNVNWSDFYVWQVSSTNNGKSHMDQLWCGASKESMEHVNDFNAGNNPDHAHVGPATFMYNSGTKEFAYQESLTDGAHTVYDHFVCIPGSVIAPNDPEVNKYYYVGFDYEATGTDANQHVDRDFYYNDWIVRINPGEYKNAVRIVCEDLGTTDDFDFNDVVFDAIFDPIDYYNTNQIVITVRAAGGTLPLSVGGTEVHAALGVGVKEMVNTGKKSVPIAIYRIPFNAQRTYSNADYDKIEIKVEGNDAIYVLQAPVGKAPEKILVDDTFDWPTERQGIGEKYNLFSDYTQNPSKYTYSRWWNQN
jgi:hypothetical protein